ncbi:MAG: cation diffusion facilitator family transporter [Pseudonocardiaceae bacterium]|nr:cation diffusion facilitator family transporter [Pseudonocardiaceae bacterium]
MHRGRDTRDAANRRPGGEDAGHGHGHDRPAREGWVHRLRHAVTPHSHDAADRVDAAMESSRRGMRALWVSLAVLAVTALAQAAVVVASGSVALLSDTLHNVADALTAVPVGIAFLLARRPANRRFTYGYGRAEDLAGVVVVLVIAATAIAAGIESVRRLAHPTDVDHLVAVALAGVVGFIGNEVAAQVRIRTGRAIGSAALVADGLHARTDALASLAVLASAGGAALGWRLADPIVGLAIAVAIAAVTWSAGREVLGRLMDAVDPALVDAARTAVAGTPGVTGVDGVRLRWIGHALRAEVKITVPGGLTLSDAHVVAHDAEARLHDAVGKLSGATVHAHPTCGQVVSADASQDSHQHSQGS